METSCEDCEALLDAAEGDAACAVVELGGLEKSESVDSNVGADRSLDDADCVEDKDAVCIETCSIVLESGCCCACVTVVVAVVVAVIVAVVVRTAVCVAVSIEVMVTTNGESGVAKCGSERIRDRLGVGSSPGAGGLVRRAKRATIALSRAIAMLRRSWIRRMI